MGVFNMASLATARPVDPNISTAFYEACRAACYTGGSGLGVSHYAQASVCGRKARLSRERALRAQAEAWPLPQSVHPLSVGSIYHWLHQAWYTSDPRLEGMYQPHDNPNVAEAVHLFLGYARFHPRDFWGRRLAVEYSLPNTDATRERVLDMFGHPVTAALDLVVEIDEAQLAEIYKRRPLLRGQLVAGRYIIDHKTASQPGSEVPYREGNQALWYPSVYNLEHPDAPVMGIIFDVMYKYGRRKARQVLPTDFHAVLCYSSLARPETLCGMVKQGALNVLQDTPNRAHCHDFRGFACPFFGDGCDGM
jgi:hypothetical protein